MLATTSAFNSLRDISELGELNFESKAEQLGDVIIKHRLCDIVGVTLLHKHFNLDEEEQVVQSIRMQEENRQLFIEVKKAHRGRIPYMWCLSAEGSWQPLQFMDDEPLIRKRALELFSKLSFLEEFAATLDRLSASEELGLCLKFYDLVGANLETDILIESTNRKARWQVFNIRTEVKEEAITTHWLFSESENPFTKKCCCALRCLKHDDGHETDHYEPARC